MNQEDFLTWEKEAYSIDLKPEYVDLAGDLVAGVLLSQIVYWHLPPAKKNGKTTKLTQWHDGELWLAKQRGAWWSECRITLEQYKRAIRVLEAKELVYTRGAGFAGDRCVKIRLNWPVFLARLSEVQLCIKGETPLIGGRIEGETHQPKGGKPTERKGGKPPSKGGKPTIIEGETPFPNTETTQRPLQRAAASETTTKESAKPDGFVGGGGGDTRPAAAAANKDDGNEAKPEPARPRESIVIESYDVPDTKAIKQHFINHPDLDPNSLEGIAAVLFFVDQRFCELPTKAVRLDIAQDAVKAGLTWQETYNEMFGVLQERHWDYDRVTEGEPPKIKDFVGLLRYRIQKAGTVKERIKP